jgi:hypothetical protein
MGGLAAGCFFLVSERLTQFAHVDWRRHVGLGGRIWSAAGVAFSTNQSTTGAASGEDDRGAQGGLRMAMSVSLL